MSDLTLSVSAVLLSFNCEQFIGEALRSVLHQDYPSLEILISDDASEDATVDVIQRVLAHYDGPHPIRLNRRCSNSGSKTAHLNAIFSQVGGDLIVFFDGDDISLRQRVTKLAEPFHERGETQAVYSGMSLIDRDGRRLGPSPVPHPAPGTDSTAWFANVDSYAAGGTLAIRRSVIDSFGVMDPEINEDILLPFRASLLGSVEFINQPLVTVRRHAASLTTNLDQYASMDHYRARMEAGIALARRKAAARVSDIATAQEFRPRPAAELQALRQIVNSSLSEAEITRHLFSSSWRKRWLALAKLIKAKAYPEQLTQHVCLALVPNLYLRYKRYMVARRIR
jgi:GT2 family glycosyltransferase